MRSVPRVGAVACVVLVCAGCGDDGPSLSHLSFTGQTCNWGAAVEGVDEFVITSIQGPPGATISDPVEGTYVVEGTYTLASSPTAWITLGFWGSYVVTNEQDYDITAPGSGTFVVSCTLLDASNASDLFLHICESPMMGWLCDVTPTDI